MELIFGAGKLDRGVADAERLLRDWRDQERDFGQLYLEYEPVTPRDRVVLEDLAVTMLVNSRVEARQAMGFFRNCGSLDLSGLPEKPLGATTEAERADIANLIGVMTSWPGVGASVSTKTLHKKRPELIPILDNMAIFGAYMNPLWPQQRAKEDTVKAVPRIKEALDWIAIDVARPENKTVWERLQEIERTARASSCSTWSGGCTSRLGVEESPPSAPPAHDRRAGYSPRLRRRDASCARLVTGV